MQLSMDRVVGCLPDGKSLVVVTVHDSDLEIVIVSMEEWLTWSSVLEHAEVDEEERSLNFNQAA